MKDKTIPPNPAFPYMIFLIVWTVIGFYCLHLDNMGKFDKTITVATGTVTDKEYYQTSCGKHGRRTCGHFVVEIDKTTYELSSSEFYSTEIGKSFTIYRTVKDSPWYVSMFIIGLIPVFLGMIITLGIALAHEDYYHNIKK